MIILNLVVFNKEQLNDVVSNVLKNKWALHVIVGNTMDCYHMDEFTVKNHCGVHIIQFATKSLLFGEIETTLKKEFPAMDFIIYAAPAVHVDTVYYDKIKNRISGLTLPEKALVHP
jgi:hypothetical protein